VTRNIPNGWRGAILPPPPPLPTFSFELTVKHRIGYFFCGV
jgi:hypothetical protein